MYKSLHNLSGELAENIAEIPTKYSLHAPLEIDNIVLTMYCLVAVCDKRQLVYIIYMLINLFSFQK